MNKRDYYTVLELSRACAPHDIKQSYRRLVLKWHPDKCVDKLEAELKFNEIHEAYTVLSDLSKKQHYDKYGHQGLADQESNGSGPNKFFQKGFRGVEKSAFDVLNDILKEKEDDYFFQNYEGFGISDNFKSSIKTFIEDNVFQSEQDLSGNSFFDTYKPTFMNPNFFMESSTLLGADFGKCTTSSFSFQAMDTDEKTYSRTSTSASQDGKITSLFDDIIQDKNITAQRETCKNSQKTCNNSSCDTQTNDSEEKPKVKRASYILISETVQDDPLYTYTRDAEFYTAFELNRRMTKESEANSNISDCSKKITKSKESLNIRLVNKKPSKKNRN